MTLRWTILAVAIAAAACNHGRDTSGGSSADSARAATPGSSAAGAARAANDSSSAGVLDPATWVLRADGIGPVRTGMTVAEANAALAGGLDRTSGLGACGYVRPQGGPAGVRLMVENGRIVRAEVGDGARVVTALGARPGEPESRVLEMYPGARVRPRKYVAAGHDVIVVPGAPADTTHRIVFETDGAQVTSMRGGEYPAVEYVEGCS